MQVYYIFTSGPLLLAAFITPIISRNLAYKYFFLITPINESHWSNKVIHWKELTRTARSPTWSPTDLVILIGETFSFSFWTSVMYLFMTVLKSWHIFCSDCIFRFHFSFISWNGTKGRQSNIIFRLAYGRRKLLNSFFWGPPFIPNIALTFVRIKDLVNHPGFESRHN